MVFYERGALTYTQGDLLFQCYTKRVEYIKSITLHTQIISFLYFITLQFDICPWAYSKVVYVYEF